MTDKMQYQNAPKGITLLLVVLVLSLVVTIGLGITTLIIKQFEQGADARGAVAARNAADSGVEEILYKTKTARSGLPSAFIADLTASFGCNNTAGKAVGQGTFCTDEGQSYETEDELITSLAEDETTTLDLYDPSNPGGGDEITAIELTGSADPGTWIEVSWAAWNSSTGQFEILESSTKEFFDANAADGLASSRKIYLKKKEEATRHLYFVNDPSGIGICDPSSTDVDGCYCTTTDSGTYPECSPVTDINDSHLNYVIRIKSLFGTTNELRVKTKKDCLQQTACAGGADVPIPSRVSIKVLGKFNNLQQSVRLSIPWRYAAAGLFDYVLLAEEDLFKIVRVSPGFYTTGIIEAEAGASFTALALPNILPDTPYDCPLGILNVDGEDAWRCGNWDAAIDDRAVHQDIYTAHARCQREPGIDASGGGTCGFEMQDASAGALDNRPRITFPLTEFTGLDPDTTSYGYQVNYLNARFRVTSQFENESIDLMTCRKEGTPGCYTTGPETLFDESTGTGSIDSPQAHKDEDGWVLCSQRVSVSTKSYIQFLANDNFQTEPSPRVDWINLSTIPYTTSANVCEFIGDWKYDATEFTFEVEDKITPQDVPGDETWCCQNWFDDDPGLQCDQPAEARRCTNYVDANGNSLGIRDYLGYSSEGSTHMLCSDRDIYYPGGGVTVDPHYNGTNGCVIQTYSGNKIGYAIPVEEFLAPNELGEGDYYISMREYETIAGSQIAIRPAYSIDEVGIFEPSVCADDFNCTRGEYVAYLERLVNRDATLEPGLPVYYSPTLVTTINQGNSNWAPLTQCYFAAPQRVKAGDSIIVLIEETSGSHYISIDDIDLSQDPPVGLPAC